MSVFKWKSGSSLKLKDIFHTVVRVTAYNVLQHKTHSSFFGVCKAGEIFMRVIRDVEENTRQVHYPATPRGTDLVM